MTFRSRWSCDIQFHKYAVHINGDFYDKLRPQILSVGTTATAALIEVTTWAGLTAYKYTTVKVYQCV